MSVGTVTISKTDYLNWLTCPGYAWVVQHRPDIAPPETDTARRKQLAGDMVEELARTIYPTGFLIDSDNPVEAARLTREAIADGQRILFHGTVITDRGLVAEADILIREDTGWHLVEIKSSTADPAKPNGLVKKHLPDITFQTIVLEEAGIPVSRGSLLHIDKHYRRNGRVEPVELLALTEVTEAIAGARESTETSISEALDCLQDTSSPAACDCDRKTRANRCELFGHFHPHIPASGTVYNISGLHLANLLPALDRGVLDLTHWPDDLPLSARQRRQVELARSGEQILQRERIASLFERFRYPLHFLDYETFQQPIPLWEGQAPNQQVPFQYSLHVVEEDGSIDHREHLCVTRDENPVPALLGNLASDVGENGSVIVWNKAFEGSRNREMAALMPEYAGMLTDINRRMLDLADIVSKGWWVHPAFDGRWSLKSVLPVAAPDLAYDDLAIGDGGTASELWIQGMIDDIDLISDEERSRIISALHDYCSLDTLAMVRIWQHVRELIAS